MMQFDKNKIVRGLVIALTGIGAFWVGGFLLLTKGEDWGAIELAIQNSLDVKTEVKSEILNVSPEFLGYSYGTSAASGYANFKAEIQYVGGKARYQIYMTQTVQVWKVASIRKL